MLYTDPDTGQAISTHSMIRTFRRCPQQTLYKYVQRLKPKSLGRPLRAGTWFHKLMEVHYAGDDWREAHKELCQEFSKLFDEEKDEIGDLPRDMLRLMTSYLWHYAADEWKVHETEFVLECEFPDGTLYRAKIDLLIENQFGLWIVDHKTNKKTPDLTFRMLDSQSALYIWCAIKNKIPVQGHIWNYVRSKPPSQPTLLKSGTGLSRSAKIVTDYPHLMRALKRFDLPIDEHQDQLNYLLSQRYQPGQMQTSPFFRRDVLEKSNKMLTKVASEAYHTSKRMHSYPFDKPQIVERVIDRSCTFTCSYSDICSMELFGGDTRNVRRTQFEVGDPMSYYQDDRMEKG